MNNRRGSEILPETCEGDYKYPNTKIPDITNYSFLTYFLHAFVFAIGIRQKVLAVLSFKRLTKHENYVKK